MPELPEVETVRRGLEPVMAGARILRVDLRRPDLRFPLPDRFAERLAGQRIESMRRRAKYLLARLDNGEVLVMHLGMSGRFGFSFGASGTPAAHGPDAPGYTVGFTGDAPGGRRPGGVSPGVSKNDIKHDHVVFELEGGARVVYNDPRRFGFMDLIPEASLDQHKLFAGMGPEPLGNGFDATYLAGRARGKATDLKAFLLDQRNIAGLGNIYVCEALFRADLSPRRAAGCLALKSGRPTERCERLVPAIRQVLEDAIAAGGSTLRDYRHTDGALGYFQHSFKVYGREGEPCTRDGCSGIIGRIVQAGRSTFYCRTCQR